MLFLTIKGEVPTMKKNYLTSLIVLLVLIAVILGGLILRQQLASQPTTTAKTSTPTATPKASLKPLTIVDIKEVFKKFPSDKATATEKKSFEQYLLTVGFMPSDNAVTIKNCQMSPNVLITKKDQTITFKNQDSTIHRLLIAGKEYQVKANDNLEIKSLPNTGPFGYFCDNQQVGVIEATE
jgi:cytoskeletal protein RodZ